MSNGLTGLLLGLALALALAFAAPTEARAQGGSMAPDAPPDSLRIARTMAERGESCVAAFGIAARQFDHAEARPDSTALVARVFLVLSTISRLGGDIGTAAVFSETALALADILHAPDSPLRGEYLLEHALTTRLSGQPGAALRTRTLIDEGVRVVAADHGFDRRLHADLLQARANLTRAARDHDLAIEQYAAALEIRVDDTAPHGLDVVDNECWLARATLIAGDIPSAEALLLHCENDLTELGLAGHPLMSVVLVLRAMIVETREDLSLTIDLYERAGSGLKSAQLNLFPGFSQRRLESPTLDSLAFLRLKTGDGKSAWTSFIEGRRSSGGQAAALARAREENPGLATRVRKSATASVHSLGEVQLALEGLRERPVDQATRARSLRSLARYARQMARTLSLKDQLRIEHGATEAAPPSIAQLQEHLRPTQAIIGYFDTYDRVGLQLIDGARVSYTVVLRKDRAPHWIPMDAGAFQASGSAWSEYNGIMKKASEWPTRLPDDPRIRDLLRALYRERFQPLESDLDGVREILVLPLPSGGSFPFPALIDGRGRSLVDRYAFRHLFGVSNLISDDRSEVDSGTPSLILGDPSYTAKAVSLSTPDPDLAQALSSYAVTVVPRSVVDAVLREGQAGLHELPRLQNSGWEARGIASMTSPVTLLTGMQATEQSLNRAFGGSKPRRYRWIHLATHALMHHAIPEHSALALSPRAGEGLLYVEEIGFGWILDCDLVTLSGCQTGGGPRSSSIGPLGFIQALHAAGARNVLLSTGKVDDIATALLMERFYANVSANASPRVEPSAEAPLPFSEALAEAQRWLRDLRAPDGRQTFAHPVYWANFRLIGSGG